MCACCLCIDINYIFILVIAGLLKLLIACRHSSSQRPHLPSPFFLVSIACPHLFSWGGGRAAGVTRLLGVLPAYVGFYGLLTCCAFSFCKPAEVCVVTAFPGRC
jgi:hypothetical protein